MSTKMYNYRLPKEQWWSFAKAVRQLYREEHPICKAVTSATTDSYRQATNAIDSMVDGGWTVELQLFDEGDTWLIRPLEHGYFFMNNHEQWCEPFGLESVWFDNRSDVPPEQEKNRAVAEWVDERIMSGEYLMFNIVTKDDLMQMFLDRRWKSRGEAVKQ